MTDEQQVTEQEQPKPTEGKPVRSRWGPHRKVKPETFDRVEYLLTFGRNLRRWREKRKLPKTKLALAIGVSARTLTFVESRHPRAIRHHIIEKCAMALGVQPAILMLDADSLRGLMAHLLEIHEMEDVLLALSQAIAERRGCAVVPPAL